MIRLTKRLQFPLWGNYNFWNCPNAPITTEEVTTTLKNLTNNKVPWPWWIHGWIFIISQKSITDTLRRVYKPVWEGGPYLSTGYQAYIKLISKKGKDPTDPASYRPNSLINLDAKIMSKNIASWLAKWLPSITHPAQAGFICHLIMALENAKLHPDLYTAIITLDDEKALDNIDLQWLFMAPKKNWFLRVYP